MCAHLLLVVERVCGGFDVKRDDCSAATRRARKDLQSVCMSPASPSSDDLILVPTDHRSAGKYLINVIKLIN